MNKLTAEEINRRKSEKVMVITVGTGREGSDIAQAINLSISTQNPKVVYFIVSVISEESTLPFVLDKIDQNEIEVQKYLYDEVNDVEKLCRKYGELLDKIINRRYQRNKIVVDYTSGTKAMSAALISAALTREIGTISYIYGERDKGGRVIPGTERSSILSPSALYTEQRIKLFVEFFNKYQYESAIDVLNSINIHPDFKEKSELYITLASAYSYWDRFQFKEALNLLDNIESIKLLNKLGLRTKIETDIILLDSLLDKKSDDELINDLISNSRRRYDEGKYDDAVARLYRSLEMIAQSEFKKEFRCSTDNVIEDNLPSEIKEEVIRKYKDGLNGKIKIGSYRSFDILKLKKNKKSELFFKHEKDFREILSSRNESILAHGNTPVKKASYEKFYKLITDIFELKTFVEFPKLKA